jgi:hypothetical protein
MVGFVAEKSAFSVIEYRADIEARADDVCQSMHYLPLLTTAGISKKGSGVAHRAMPEELPPPFRIKPW